jgi:hypothetical protein
MVKLRQRSGGALLILAGLVVGLFPLVATAAPVDDGGQDTAWSEPMNHEPYWEDYFAAAGRIVECTKFENHSGSSLRGTKPRWSRTGTSSVSMSSRARTRLWDRGTRAVASISRPLTHG